MWGEQLGAVARHVLHAREELAAGAGVVPADDRTAAVVGDEARLVRDRHRGGVEHGQPRATVPEWRAGGIPLLHVQVLRRREREAAHPHGDHVAGVGGHGVHEGGGDAGVAERGEPVAGEARRAEAVEALHLDRALREVRPEEHEVAVARLDHGRVALAVAVAAQHDAIGAPDERAVRRDPVRVDVEVGAGARVGEGEHAVVVAVGDQVPADQRGALRVARHEHAAVRELLDAVAIEALHVDRVDAVALVEPGDVAAAVAGGGEARHGLVADAVADRQVRRGGVGPLRGEAAGEQERERERSRVHRTEGINGVVPRRQAQAPIGAWVCAEAQGGRYALLALEHCR